MRLIKAALLVTVLALAATTAQAGSMTFGLGGGVAFPSGDFSDVAKMGYNANVYGDYWLKPQLAIGVDVDGSFFSGKDEFKDDLAAAFPAFPDPSISANLIGGSAHIKYAFAMEGSKMAPWITGGLGMYNAAFKIEDSDPLANEDSSESDFGYNLGGGIDWKSSPTMSPGIDARWYQIQTEDESTSYYTIGLHLTFSTTGTTQ